MYPNEYRNNTNCIWDINVPSGLKVVLTFTVLDIGSKSTCNYDYNIVSIYDVTSDGMEDFATSYCGGVSQYWDVRWIVEKKKIYLKKRQNKRDNDSPFFLLDFYLLQDDPAPFIATSNRLIVKYISSVNNIGTGWKATFEGRSNYE